MSRAQGLLAAALLAGTLITGMNGSAFAYAQDHADRVRLSPTEIEALTRAGAGAGTSGLAGIQTTILLGDPTQTGPYAIEIRVPAHTRIAAHEHRDHRSAVVISGVWYFGYGAMADEAATEALPPGSFYTEAADDAHFAMTKGEPVRVYITGWGPTDTRFTATPAP